MKQKSVYGLMSSEMKGKLLLFPSNSPLLAVCMLVVVVCVLRFREHEDMENSVNHLIEQAERREEEEQSLSIFCV